MIAQAQQKRTTAPPAGMHRSWIRIADVSIALNASCGEDLRLTSELNAFRTGEAKCDIEISIAWAERLQRPMANKLFDSGAVWTMYECDQGYIIDFETPVFGLRPYKRLCVDRSFSEAQLLLSRECLGELDLVHALEYPLDELLVTNWLAQGKGVEVHGCGLVDGPTGGHLFVGHSGAGKSTTARLWELLRGPEILSDDRIILRLHDGELWMYGTPWHGEAAFAAPGSAKLDRIHILRHGTQNRFAALPQARAVGEIFARSFPPFHSPAGLERTVEFIKQALDLVPCYEFEFTPDGSAVAAVLGFHE